MVDVQNEEISGNAQGNGNAVQPVPTPAVSAEDTPKVPEVKEESGETPKTDETPETEKEEELEKEEEIPTADELLKQKQKEVKADDIDLSTKTTEELQAIQKDAEDQVARVEAQIKANEEKAKAAAEAAAKEAEEKTKETIEKPIEETESWLSSHKSFIGGVTQTAVIVAVVLAVRFLS